MAADFSAAISLLIPSLCAAIFTILRFGQLLGQVSQNLTLFVPRAIVLCTFLLLAASRTQMKTLDLTKCHEESPDFQESLLHMEVCRHE